MLVPLVRGVQGQHRLVLNRWSLQLGLGQRKLVQRKLSLELGQRTLVRSKLSQQLEQCRLEQQRW